MTKKKNRTYIVREKEVMLDKDLANIFDIETKQLNRRVKRHIDKFFDERFQLTDDEYNSLRCQNGTSSLDFGTLKKRGEHSKYSPFVFTRKGVEILVDILKKEVSLDFFFDTSIEAERIIKDESLTSKIFFFRNEKIMIDSDLAILFQVETKRLNEQVKRNLERFPERFRFQLNQYEMNELVANCDRFKTLKHSSNLPFAFTEQGIAMLATVLTSEIAVKTSIQIMDAFVEMRKLIQQNDFVFQKINIINFEFLMLNVELRQVV